MGSFCSGGYMPWGHQVHLADAQPHYQHITLDENYDFYPDYRHVSEIMHLPWSHYYATYIRSFPSQQQIDPPSCPQFPGLLISYSPTMPTYYAYGAHQPHTLQCEHSARHYKDEKDQLRSYDYIPAHEDEPQGSHPPAPIIQNQGFNPNMYYYAHNAGLTAPTPYYANGYYYANAHPYSSGYYPSGPFRGLYPDYMHYPTCYPPSSHRNNYTAVSNSMYYTAMGGAGMLGHAGMVGPPPAYHPIGAMAGYGMGTGMGPTPFYGGTRAQIDAENARIHYESQPSQMVPYKPVPGTQFWCKELDGSWTLRSYSDMVIGELAPGHWESAKTGYHYWVRRPA